MFQGESQSSSRAVPAELLTTFLLQPRALDLSRGGPAGGLLGTQPLAPSLTPQFNPSSTTPPPCDLGHIIEPLCASVPLSVAWRCGSPYLLWLPSTNPASAWEVLQQVWHGGGASWELARTGVNSFLLPRSRAQGGFLTCPRPMVPRRQDSSRSLSESKAHLLHQYTPLPPSPDPPPQQGPWTLGDHPRSCSHWVIKSLQHLLLSLHRDLSRRLEAGSRDRQAPPHWV